MSFLCPSVFLMYFEVGFDVQIMIEWCRIEMYVWWVDDLFNKMFKISSICLCLMLDVWFLCSWVNDKSFACCLVFYVCSSCMCSDWSNRQMIKCVVLCGLSVICIVDVLCLCVFWLSCVDNMFSMYVDVDLKPKFWNINQWRRLQDSFVNALKEDLSQTSMLK